MKRILLSTMLVGFLCASEAKATDYPPADHGGGDLALSDGDRIWGEHTNIGTFTVNAGATATVRFYEGTNVPGGTPDATLGMVSVEAENIAILGTLDGTGSGYTGGGGGGGGGCLIGFGVDAIFYNGGPGGKGRYDFGIGATVCYGLPGTNASMCTFCCHQQCTFDAGNGGSGDGPDSNYVTAPFDEWWRACGGYMSGGGGFNYDTTTDEYIRMGSGGKGTYGGAGGFAVGFGHVAGEGGAAGGSGGGSIRLVGHQSLAIGSSGVVKANGTMGGPRNDGPTSDFTGRPGADAYPYDFIRTVDTSNWYVSGGAGGGGGILLKCEHHGGLVLQPGATISNLGGGALTQNGGTVKIFYVGNPPSETGVTILTGRKFTSAGASSAGPGWMMYE